MNNLDFFKVTFNHVGWFIPPYVSMGFLSVLGGTISDKGVPFTQDDLEKWLSLIYSPENLAAMVIQRYPITPAIQEYKEIISESILAHFHALDHVAVSGLMPVIEGVGKKLAKSRSVDFEKKSSKDLFVALAKHCKTEAKEKNLGAVDEVISMLDSFIDFVQNHLYVTSGNYSLSDKTNRHGILHGEYSDAAYGKPINFYKTIAAVNFLCFISAFRAPISWMAPSPTENSRKLANYYLECRKLALNNPVPRLPRKSVLNFLPLNVKLLDLPKIYSIA